MVTVLTLIHGFLYWCLSGLSGLKVGVRIVRMIQETDILQPLETLQMSMKW
jgi:hypothetical protein